jgi:Eukaryotic aspartyl protease
MTRGVAAVAALLAGAPVRVPDQTCTFVLQTYVNVSLGGQQMTLMLDTGSSSILVASRLCGASCGDAVRWDQTLGVATTHLTSGRFGDGHNSWAAKVYTVDATIGGVTVAGAAVAAVTSQVNQSAVWDETCSYHGVAGPVFSGILGVGPPAAASPYTTDWMTQALVGGDPVFTVTQCMSGGTLTLGAAPDGATFVPPGKYAGYWYTVPLTSARVGGGASLSTSGAIVVIDTGAQANFLPQALYDELIAALGGRMAPGDYEFRLTADELNQLFPPMHLVLEGGVQLNVPAVGAYLGVVGSGPGYNVVRFVAQPTFDPALVIMGWPFISAFAVGFNVTPGAVPTVGFASVSTSACGSAAFGGAGGGGTVGYDGGAGAGPGVVSESLALIIGLSIGFGLLAVAVSAAVCECGVRRSRRRRGVS